EQVVKKATSKLTPEKTLANETLKKFATLGYSQAAIDKRVITCIGDGKFQVFREEDLIEAIETTKGAKKDWLCFIEVMAHKDNTSTKLLEWGSRLSSANSRPLNPT
nr:pyruvate decarboxylase 2 [Tanacetum cinerariifolium]